ncbi:bifunctional folylpolyglutamate synthase/dihydrofolate synthase [bacterium]|nr:bifunctional folylpolyglutamate synthase/dihydrofolate synthase [bacterium]
MNYEQTLDFLYNQLPFFQRQGKAAFNKDLGKTVALCNAVGNPQHSLKFIHVAGTNGKGSVSHLLASVCKEAGYRTGLYTSPHLVDFRERIVINGELIEKSFITEWVNTYLAEIEAIKPSFFELTFAMSLSYFNAKACDMVVLETGMGGRLDSTNIVLPEVAVITNVGMDHMEYLGDTIPKIAAEKAGIIKKNLPVVLGDSNAEVVEVVAQKALIEGSELFKSFDIFSVEGNEPFSIYYKNEKWMTVNSPLTANYQRQNLSTVCTAFMVLAKNPGLEKKHLKAGIENLMSNFPLYGRWQQLGSNPTIICDVGHNADGINAALNQLESIPYEKLHIVFGMVNDKDTAVIDLLPKAANYHLCAAKIPRALPVDDLQKLFTTHGLTIASAHNSVAAAYNCAVNEAEPNDVVLVLGSLFVVAEVLEPFLNK